MNTKQTSALPQHEPATLDDIASVLRQQPSALVLSSCTDMSDRSLKKLEAEVRLHRKWIRYHTRQILRLRRMRLGSFAPDRDETYVNAPVRVQDMIHTTICKYA